MNDRLAELKRKKQESGNSNSNSNSNNNHGGNPLSTSEIQMEDLESGGGHNNSNNNNNNNPKFMEDFFVQVESVKEDIANIRDAIKEMARINQEALLATSGPKEQKLSKELEHLLATTTPKCNHAKDTLKKMKEQTSILKNTKKGKNSSETRIQENLVNTLTRKFVDVMKDYQNAQQKYKVFVKKKVARQVQIVKPEATQEEIDAVMEQGGTDELFKNAIVKSANESVKNVYDQVQDRYQDVLQLEQSLKALHEMFMEFAYLTEMQGELLDQIEYQVKSAADFIEDGNVEIGNAIDIAKKVRKRECCVIACVLTVIFIIVMYIMLTTGAFNA